MTMTGDATVRLLEGIAEAFNKTADIMHEASRSAGADGRPIISDYAEGLRDAFRVAADHVLEVAVTPDGQRQIVADSFVSLTPADIGEATRGRPLEVPDARH